MKYRKWQLEEQDYNGVVEVYEKLYNNLCKGVIFAFIYNPCCVWQVVDNARGIVLSGAEENLSEAKKQVDLAYERLYEFI